MSTQVVLLQLPLISDEAAKKTLVKKLGPPLVTLLSEEAEVQYVALRNINLIVQQHPEVLSHEIKVLLSVFHCGYKTSAVCPEQPMKVRMKNTEVHFVTLAGYTWRLSSCYGAQEYLHNSPSCLPNRPSLTALMKPGARYS